MGNETHANRVRNKIQVDGKEGTPDTTEVEILLQDDAKDVLMARGATVPTADEDGYAKGCLFIKTDAVDGTKGLYENQGTKLLSDFNLIGDITTAEIADLAVTTAKLADDAVTSDKLDSSIIKYVDVQLTAVQIKALAGTNIELVPATEAGVGYAILPIAVNLRLTAGSEVLTESDDNLALRYNASTELMEIEVTGFIDQATDQNRYQAMAEALMTPEENVALDLDNNGTAEIAGNASDDALLDIRVYYRVIPVK